MSNEIFCQPSLQLYSSALSKGSWILSDIMWPSVMRFTSPSLILHIGSSCKFLVTRLRSVTHTVEPVLQGSRVWWSRSESRATEPLLLRSSGASRTVSASAVRVRWLLLGRVPMAHEAENKGTSYHVEKTAHHQFQRLKLEHPVGAASSTGWQSSRFSPRYLCLRMAASVSFFPLPGPAASSYLFFKVHLKWTSSWTTSSRKPSLLPQLQMNSCSKILYLSYGTCHFRVAL